MEGQVFVSTAIAVSLLILLAALPVGPLLSDDSSFRNFFRQSFQEKSSAFNEALERNRTADGVMREIYAYDYRIDRLSADREIQYSSYSLSVHPDRGEARFVNFAPSEREVDIAVDGSWTNTTVGERLWLERNFSAGTVEVELRTEGDVQSFEAASPRIAYGMRMESGSEGWENSRIG